jgi:drug/metabolite transporter (DMT)-like permease
MNWINTAILSSVSMAVVNIVQSHLLSKRLPGMNALLLPACFIQSLIALVLFLLFPLPSGIGFTPLGVAFCSAACRAAGVLILFYNLRRVEVSQIIPVVQTYPIFVALIAVPLLGESLSSLEWLAIVIVVAGAVLVSMRESSSGSNTLNLKLLAMLFTASLLFALADVAGKYALDYMSFWNFFWFSSFSMSAIWFALSARIKTAVQLSGIKEKKTVFILLVTDEILVIVGTTLLFFSIANGPVSLVSTIAGIRPMFVFIFAMAVNYICPAFLKTKMNRKILIIRLIATAMIVGGISIIHLID